MLMCEGNCAKCCQCPPSPFPPFYHALPEACVSGHSFFLCGCNYQALLVSVENSFVFPCVWRDSLHQQSEEVYPYLFLPQVVKQLILPLSLRCLFWQL